MKRIITSCLALLLFCAMLLPCMPVKVEAASSYNKMTDEVSRSTKEITLANGTKTGVNWTQIKLNGEYYGKELIVNAAEFNLANTNLSVEVINSGNYLVSKQTVGNAITTYNSTHSGQAVLAAVNGDLWMTGNHYNGVITSGKTLCVSRGIMLIDGEIWATQQIDQENLDSSTEKDLPTEDKNAFGVTSSNQPLVGEPKIGITMSVNGKTIQADGLNRLPCRNAIIVYNHRVNSYNYALTDSYEVELEVVGSSAFSLTGTVTAKVKAVYPAGTASRPAIGSNTILLTARGNRISELQTNFPVGATVTFSSSVTDTWNDASMWLTVKDAIGGYIPVVKDNMPDTWNTTTSGYPTTFIGIKDDGTVAFVTVTRSADDTYSALNRNQAYDFCMEYGYNRVFHLDGGGSCAFYSLENGTYTRRTSTSDGAGSERPVINSVAVVWNTTPVCSKQGSLDYIKNKADFSKISPTYLDGALAFSIMAKNHQLWTPGYDANLMGGCLRNPVPSTDPYVYLNYSLLKRVNAQDYRYVVIKLLTTHGSASNLSLYYNCGSNYKASSSRVKTMAIQGWDTTQSSQYVIFDMQGASGWTGQLNNVCLDFFDGKTLSGEETMYIQGVYLCKNDAEIALAKSGKATAPGALTDFLGSLASGAATCSHNYEFLRSTACTKAGNFIYACTHCDTQYYEAHEATGHDYQVYETTEPTCTAKGRTRSKCSYCKATKSQTTADALGHDYVNGVCSRCGNIPDCSHSNYKEEIVENPTCTAKGTKNRVCTNCDATILTEEIPVIEHTPGAWETVKNATCAADGEKVRKCTVCQTPVATEAIPATGHSYGSSVNQPSCTGQGSTVYTCSVCGDTYSEPIAALGHDYQNGTCTRCGAIDPANPPVCQHDYKATSVTNATCKAEGKTVYTCSKCSHSYEETHPVLPHTNETKTTKNPTCTAAGEKVTVCTACGHESAKQTIDALGHDYKNNVCTRCGDTIATEPPATTGPETTKTETTKPVETDPETTKPVETEPETTASDEPPVTEPETTVPPAIAEDAVNVILEKTEFKAEDLAEAEVVFAGTDGGEVYKVQFVVSGIQYVYTVDVESDEVLAEESDIYVPESDPEETAETVETEETIETEETVETVETEETAETEETDETAETAETTDAPETEVPASENDGMTKKIILAVVVVVIAAAAIAVVIVLNKKKA